VPAGVDKRRGRCRSGWRVPSAVVVAVVALAGCGGSSPQRGAGQPSGTIRYLGGAYTLASDRVPQGAEFSIIGQRYRFWRHDYLELTIHFADPAQVTVGGSGSGGSDVLEANDEEGCEVHPFAIFDGVLSQPGAGVLLRGDGRPFHTHRVALPAALHTDGVLVYGTTTGSRLGVELLSHANTGERISQPVSGSYSRPGPCSAWARERAQRAHSARAIAGTTRCLRRRGLTLIPPPYATPYLATRRRCVKEAELPLRGHAGGSPGD
jgi:hypothetical protein